MIWDSVYTVMVTHSRDNSNSSGGGEETRAAAAAATDRLSGLETSLASANNRCDYPNLPHIPHRMKRELYMPSAHIRWSALLRIHNNPGGEWLSLERCVRSNMGVFRGIIFIE